VKKPFNADDMHPRWNKAPATFEINAIPVEARVPTWRQVRDAVTKVVEKLGGQEGLAEKFGWDTYYTLTYLKCLNVDGPAGEQPMRLAKVRVKKVQRG
jgi:hypothetical protein